MYGKKRLARETGILLPIIQFRDNCALEKNIYRVLVYDREVMKDKTKDGNHLFFSDLILWIEDYCHKHYDSIINKYTVKILIDNLKSQYLGVADGVVHEKISYLKVEKKLKEKLKAGESIKDMIHIIEDLEIACCE